MRGGESSAGRPTSRPSSAASASSTSPVSAWPSRSSCQAVRPAASCSNAACHPSISPSHAAGSPGTPDGLASAAWASTGPWKRWTVPRLPSGTDGCVCGGPPATVSGFALPGSQRVLPELRGEPLERIMPSVAVRCRSARRLVSVAGASGRRAVFSGSAVAQVCWLLGREILRRLRRHVVSEDVLRNCAVGCHLSAADEGTGTRRS